MSSDDPLESIASGAVKGIIELSIEKVKELASKFRDKKLAFIEEKGVIDIVREQYASGEAKFYEKYIRDAELLLLVRLGLTLRKIEKDKIKLGNLQQKILRKYEARGLHVSYLVQNGILNRYIGLLIEGITSEQELKDKIYSVLNNIEKHTLFVQGQDKSERIIQKSLIIIASHSPSIFIVSGIGSASKIIRDCSEKLIELLKEYDVEKVSGGIKEILFFRRRLREESLK